VQKVLIFFSIYPNCTIQTNPVTILWFGRDKIRILGSFWDCWGGKLL